MEVSPEMLEKILTKQIQIDIKLLYRELKKCREVIVDLPDGLAETLPARTTSTLLYIENQYEFVKE